MPGETTASSLGLVPCNGTFIFSSQSEIDAAQIDTASCQYVAHFELDAPTGQLTLPHGITINELDIIDPDMGLNSAIDLDLTSLANITTVTMSGHLGIADSVNSTQSPSIRLPDISISDALPVTSFFLKGDPQDASHVTYLDGPGILIYGYQSSASNWTIQNSYVSLVEVTDMSMWVTVMDSILTSTKTNWIDHLSIQGLNSGVLLDSSEEITIWDAEFKDTAVQPFGAQHAGAVKIGGNLDVLRTPGGGTNPGGVTSYPFKTVAANMTVSQGDGAKLEFPKLTQVGFELSVKDNRNSTFSAPNLSSVGKLIMTGNLEPLGPDNFQSLAFANEIYISGEIDVGNSEGTLNIFPSLKKVRSSVVVEPWESSPAFDCTPLVSQLKQGIIGELRCNGTNPYPPGNSSGKSGDGENGSSLSIAEVAGVSVAAAIGGLGCLAAVGWWFWRKYRRAMDRLSDSGKNGFKGGSGSEDGYVEDGRNGGKYGRAFLDGREVGNIVCEKEGDIEHKEARPEAHEIGHGVELMRGPGELGGSQVGSELDGVGGKDSGSRPRTRETGRREMTARRQTEGDGSQAASELDGKEEPAELE